ncbi:MAG: hypothetical protein O7B35_12100 [Deltaproteobacteria bacterium]|nr:hypothetical protein [Deltaproteobacteria bacterium]
MRRADFVHVICELGFPPEPNHQLAHLSQKTDGLPVCLVVLLVERGLDLALVDRKRIFGMLFLPLGGEF